MKLKHLLVVNAITALAYGLGEVLMPATLLSTYGITTGPGERLSAQFFGVALIGVGMLSWCARNVKDPEAQRGNIFSFLIYHVVGLLVSLSGTLRGVMSGVGWSAVGIYLFLGLGFAYFQFLKPRDA